ncbi:serine hydrolase domain-containing protein [Streptomyces sp. SID8352]|uniref:serine hydrolase domain-containing protein n=1 Tax=Streptomyces sp. SID8352 TaxID=2690338 RepID=UPI00136D8D03|nr:serine hydrolase domain-containing protein [Streptomyces sp. SID8352]MYU26113.1 serine hydrolase [Streptomyces sp. SID8352]
MVPVPNGARHPTSQESPREAGRRIAIAALLVAATLTPLSGTALAAAPTPPTHVTAAGAPTPSSGVQALQQALEGVPDDDVSAALIRVGGTETWAGSAGIRDRVTQAPARPDARFRAGSVTKIVTAATVLSLVADGKVALDARADRYLPGLFPAGFPADRIPTVRQLLDYTSGLRDGASLGETDEELYANRFRTLTPRQVVAASLAGGSLSAPGTVQRYANIHYTVLGLLIESVAKDTYAHQAQIRVLRPLGMRDTGFPSPGDPFVHGVHNRAYAQVDGHRVDVTEWNMVDRRAAGDMISTTADLERLLTGLFSGALLPAPLLDAMLSLPAGQVAYDGDRQFGMGFQRLALGGGTIIWAKTGSRPGYHTVIAGDRQLSRTVVYSLNAESAKDDGEKLARRFALPAFLG